MVFFRIYHCSFGLTLHARLRIIPRLSEKTLSLLAVHIVAVILLTILFATVGLSFRMGIF